MKKVRKYFMAGTDDELQFGDMIEMDFVGEEDGVTKHSHLEMKFLPEYVDDLLEEEVIEVREEEESEDETKDSSLLDFKENTPCEALECLIDKIEELEERVDAQDEMLETMMKSLQDCIKDVQKSIADADARETKKTAKKK